MVMNERSYNNQKATTIAESNEKVSQDQWQVTYIVTELSEEADNKEVRRCHQLKADKVTKRSLNAEAGTAS